MTSEWETCPYDPAHRFLAHRMAKHLIKCRKNHLSVPKTTCPFNTTHVVPEVELQHHISVCANAGNVLAQEYSFEPEETQNVPPETAKSAIVFDDCWDQESGPVMSYNAFLNTENKNIVRCVIGLSKAKRKQFRHSERERLRALSDESSAGNDSIVQRNLPPDMPLRRIEQNAQIPPSNAKKTAVANNVEENNSGIKDIDSDIPETDAKDNGEVDDTSTPHSSNGILLREEITEKMNTISIHEDMKDDSTPNNSLDELSARFTVLLNLEKAISEEKARLQEQSKSLLEKSTSSTSSLQNSKKCSEILCSQPSAGVNNSNTINNLLPRCGRGIAMAHESYIRHILAQQKLAKTAAPEETEKQNQSTSSNTVHNRTSNSTNPNMDTTNDQSCSDYSSIYGYEKQNEGIELDLEDELKDIYKFYDKTKK